MAETYCGKTCAECTEKELLACPGCKFGPARQPDGDCTIADCCRKKGHQDCTTCSYNGTCPTLRGKNHMPEYRRKAIEAAKINAAEMARRAPIFGRWLWLLFWLIIPNFIGGIVGAIGIAKAIPALAISGTVLSSAVSLAYGCILIRLSFEEERYRPAGICILIDAALRLVMEFVPGIAGNILWTLLLSFSVAIISLIGTYYMLAAHCAAITGFNNQQAEKWVTLWRRYLYICGAAVGCVVISLIIPFLGILAWIATAIAAFVVGILPLVYLYRTAKIFRTFAAGETQPLAP